MTCTAPLSRSYPSALLVSSPYGSAPKGPPEGDEKRSDEMDDGGTVWGRDRTRRVSFPSPYSSRRISSLSPLHCRPFGPSLATLPTASGRRYAVMSVRSGRTKERRERTTVAKSQGAEKDRGRMESGNKRGKVVSLHSPSVTTAGERVTVRR